MGSTRRNVLYGVGYVWLALVGAAILSVGALGAVMFGSLVVIVAVGGVTMVGVDQHLLRRPPELELGTAPSGAPAMVFPYARASVLMSALGTPVLLVWTAVGAALAAHHGHPVGAWLLGLVAAGLAVPMVPLLRGRITVGGLYLTSTGLEYRHEGTGWSLPWHAVEGFGVLDWALLGLNQPPERHDTTRVTWRRELRIRTKRGTVVFPVRHIAGGPAAMTMVVHRCLIIPEARGDVAQGYTVDQVNELLRARPAYPAAQASAEDEAEAEEDVVLQPAIGGDVE